MYGGEIVRAGRSPILRPLILLGIAVPALVLTAALRRWYGPLPWRAALLAFVLTLAFLNVAAFTTRVPVPLDEVMRGYPFRGIHGVTESRNPMTNDTVKQILPWMQVVREELGHGRMPLWNRYQFSGYPLLGNGQSAPFAPFFLATLFVPLPGQIVAMAGLKIFVSLLFGWLFLRDEGVSEPAAWFGSTVYSFSVFQTVYLFYPLTSVTALLPAAAFALRRCVRNDQPRSAVLLALVTAAVAAGGHPESAAHIAVACAILLLFEWRRPFRPVLAATAGLALSAPAWAPVVEQALLSVRAASLAVAPHPAIPPVAAWLLLNPDGFGNPSRGNWQWIANYAMAAPSYFGLLPLALLPWARRGRDWLLAIAAALLFVVAMNWTAVGRAINAVPPLSLIAPDRLRFVVCFFVAIVAARALSRGAGLRVLVSGVAVLGLALYLLRAQWGVTLGWQSAAGVIALAAFLLMAAVDALRGRMNGVSSTASPVVAWAAFVAVLGELFTFNVGFNVPVSRAWFRPPMPILERLRELAPREPFRVVGHDWTLLPNAATQYGLEDVRGHDPMGLAAYARFFDRVAADDPSSDVKRVQEVDRPELAFLGVRFLLTDPTVTPSPSWILRYEGPDGKLFESTRARRRFFAPRADARVGAIVQESPTRLRVEIDAARETVIASSQVYAPGWRVEGAKLIPLQGTFIGLRVPAGRRTVTLEYRPLSFYGSLVVAGACLLAGGVWLRRRGALNRRRTAPSASA